MAGIRDSTARYEAWLRQEIGPDFVEADLDEKHRKMRKGAFPFLRATYWRFAETVLSIRDELAGAPQLLSIGDTHLENFGTWRDAEGRLVWGANDFDEAAVMPYPLDLVRLAASALLASDGSRPAEAICDAIRDGYKAGLAEPKPVLLERDHRELREAVLLPEDKRDDFWDDIKKLVPGPIPARYEVALRAAMQDGTEIRMFAPRQAGTGSLGRPRFLARGSWKGGPVLREAKAVVTSAWSRSAAPHDRGIRAGIIATGRYRAPDPHYSVADGIVIRRMSPNSRKIEVKDSAKDLLAPWMLKLMGEEIANCHAADPARQAAQDDLKRRDPDWLRNAAEAMALAITREQGEF